MKQAKIRKDEIVTLTGKDHARISSLSGRNLRFVAILDEGPDGPRFSRKQFERAHEAKVYKRFVLARLQKIFCQESQVDLVLEQAADFAHSLTNT